MCDLVDAKRAAITAGYFTFSGTQWNCDYDSTRNLMGINILSILGGGSLPAGLTWRDMYNNSYPASPAFMGGLAEEFFTLAVAAYNASWTHKANIRALTSTAAVLAYDFKDTLWPNPNTQL